ncbi:hypothetical protein ACLOAV_010831 [Pseudogymnoascus australis]
MKKDVTKIANSETKLKEEAKKTAEEQIDIDDKETGNGSFTRKVSPAVCGVIVYRDNQVGSVSVTGAHETEEIIKRAQGRQALS